ncbi:MAG: CPBP family intramembrane glutamic endopeptidase [Thermoanaerobaculia bacterium]
MSEPADGPEPLPSPEIPPEAAPDDRRLRLFELALVVGVSFLAPTVIALYRWWWPYERTTPEALREFLAIVDCTIGLSVLAYVLYCQGRRFWDLGLTFRVSDVGLGLAVALLSRVMSFAVVSVILAFSTDLPKSPFNLQHHTGWLAWLAVVPNAALEELIVRAYLMTEVAELTGSMAIAVFASVGFQFLYHLYLGLPAALVASGSFFVAALFYASTRRVTPLILAHSLHNFWVLAG